MLDVIAFVDFLRIAAFANEKYKKLDFACILVGFFAPLRGFFVGFAWTNLGFACKTLVRWLNAA